MTEPTRKRRGRPPLPPEERKDPKTRRLFYANEEDYKAFFDFCQGEISRELPKLQALWMSLTANAREEISHAVAGKSLVKAVEGLRKSLPGILLDECLAAQMKRMPVKKKLEMVRGDIL